MQTIYEKDAEEFVKNRFIEDFFGIEYNEDQVDFLETKTNIFDVLIKIKIKNLPSLTKANLLSKFDKYELLNPVFFTYYSPQINHYSTVEVKILNNEPLVVFYGYITEFYFSISIPNSLMELIYNNYIFYHKDYIYYKNLEENPTRSLKSEDNKTYQELSYEYVNRPAHYSKGAYEVANITEYFKLNHNLASCVEYILRAGKKPGQDTLQDLKKAQWRLNREIDILENGYQYEKYIEE